MIETNQPEHSPLGGDRLGSVLRFLEKRLSVNSEETQMLADQALHMANFLFGNYREGMNNIVFKPSNSDLAEINSVQSFGIKAIRQSKDSKNGDSPTGVWIDLERADDDLAQKARKKTLKDSIKGQAKEISFLIGRGDIKVADNFESGFEGDPIVTRKVRKFKSINSDLLGYNLKKAEEWYKEVGLDIPKKGANLEQIVKIQQLLLGMNSALINQLRAEGKMETYVEEALKQRESANIQKHELSTDVIVDVKKVGEQPIEGETKNLSLNDIIKLIDQESDPDKKIRLLDSYTQTVYRQTADVLNALPHDLLKNGGDLYSVLDGLFRIKKINGSFSGKTEVNDYFKKRIIHTADPAPIESNPNEVWGSGWQKKLRVVSHPDRYIYLKLPKSESDRLSVFSVEASQLFEDKKSEPDLVRLGMVMKEIYKLTGSEEALVLYEKVLPFFDKRINSGIDLLRKKMEFLFEMQDQANLIGTGGHPLEVAVIKMEEQMRNINIEEK